VREGIGRRAERAERAVEMGVLWGVFLKGSPQV